MTAPLPLASESTAPSHGGAAKAMHSVSDAAALAMTLRPYDEDEPLSMELIQALGGRIVELLEPVPEQIATLYELLQRQERVIEEMRVENVRLGQYNNRIEHKNSELTQGVIRLTRELDDAHALTTQIRAGALTTDTPRLVAVGE